MKSKFHSLQLIILGVLLAALLAGCGSHSNRVSLADLFFEFMNEVDEVDPPEPEPTEPVYEPTFPVYGPSDIEDEAGSIPQVIDDLFGTVDGGVYTNNTLGIGCEIAEDWTFYSEEEIMALNEVVLDILSDPDVAMVDPDDLGTVSITDMFATSPDNLSNVNVALTRLSVLEAHVLTDETIASASLEQVLKAYENMGFINCTGEIEICEFLGEEHPVIHIQASIGSALMYQTQVIMLDGRNYGVLTATSYGEDITAQLLGWFYALV